MIEIQTNNSLPVNDIKEKLDALSATYKIVINSNIKVVTVIEGGKTYSGIDEINPFIEEYASFMKRWYDCRCD